MKRNTTYLGLNLILCTVGIGLNFIPATRSMAAMPVVDVAAITQLVQNYSRMTEQLVQLQYQAQYLKQQLNALQSGQYQWSNAQNLLNQLGQNLQESQLISYSARDIDTRFKTTYPGYQPTDNYSDRYKSILNNTQSTLNAVLRNMGSNANTFMNENTRLNFIQRQSQSSTSQLQAIQAGSQVASEQVSQLQLLRQTVMAQTSSQTAYHAAQLQKDAMSEANMQRLLMNHRTQYSSKQAPKLWEPAT